MSNYCLRPSLAVQREQGEKPIFIHISTGTDYEFYLRNVSKFYRVLLIPCGKCENCVKRKSQEWTARLLKEKANFKFSYFVTLTYDDNHYKDLNKRDLQLFLKRYRKRFNLKLKYYITGEYGETTNRSHYHAIFFQDKPLKDLKIYGNNLFVSDSFNDCWQNGNCLISEQVNERSIKYTIAYTLKKLGETKIIIMSKGLGLAFLNENKERIKAHQGFYTLNGYKQRFPSYFLRKLKESDDSSDIEYLKNLEDKPRGSVLLSGSTLDDLSFEFLSRLSRPSLKGKGDL